MPSCQRHRRAFGRVSGMTAVRQVRGIRPRQDVSRLEGVACSRATGDAPRMGQRVMCAETVVNPSPSDSESGIPSWPGLPFAFRRSASGASKVLRRKLVREPVGGHNEVSVSVEQAQDPLRGQGTRVGARRRARLVDNRLHCRRQSWTTTESTCALEIRRRACRCTCLKCTSRRRGLPSRATARVLHQGRARAAVGCGPFRPRSARS